MIGNQKGYREQLRSDRQLRKAITSKEIELKKVSEDLSRLYSGIYDKPMPQEMQEIYGWLAYMLCRDSVEASVRSHIPEPLLKRLAEQNGWNMERKDYYDMVKLQIKKEIEENVLPKQADLAVACVRRAYKIANSVIDEEKLDELSKADIIRKLAETAVMLQGESQPTVNIPGLSMKANAIFMQLNQSMQEESGEDGYAINEK